MSRNILTYGLTLAVTICTFTVLAQSDAGNQFYSAKGEGTSGEYGSDRQHRSGDGYRSGEGYRSRSGEEYRSYEALRRGDNYDRDAEYRREGEYSRNKEYGNGGDLAAIIPLQQAIDSLLAQRGGHILEAELEHEDGRRLYEVKGVDAEGKRYKVYLNAYNGQTSDYGDDD